MKLFYNKKAAMKNSYIVAMIIFFCVVILIMAIVLLTKFNCPACQCPQPEKCPSCVCQPNINSQCPQPICPGYCNITQEQINNLTDSIYDINCLPSNLQKVALFSIVMGLISVGIAFIGGKNFVVSLISGLAYCGILIYMTIIGYSEYAMYGFIIFLAVLITRLFIKENVKNKED